MRRRLEHGSILAVILTLSLCGCSDSGDTGGGPADTSTALKPVSTPKQEPAATKQADFITLATTTSFDNTGLAQVLAEQFAEETGIQVKIAAKGTGAALREGEEGNADVLVAHAPPDEQKLVDSGHCIARVVFMHNTFMIVGPESDPANVADAADAGDAFRRIAQAGADFVSRGDDSGTHKKEREIWAAVGLNPKPGDADWYLESSTGMGKTLSIANDRNAYTLTDNGTYVAYKAEGRIDLANLCDKGDMLYNPYSVMLVNPDKFESGLIKAGEARKFAEFLQREDVQKQIGQYKRDEYNQSLFVPDLLPQADDE